MATLYKQSSEIKLPSLTDKIKNFYWKVRRWGKDEESGLAYVEVIHFFIKDEPLTSKTKSERYEKNMSGSPTLTKVQTYLLTLPEYSGSNVE